MTETTSLAETTVTTYTYDAANRLLVSVSPGHLVTYDWDARGNLVSDGTFTYAYNAAGRLVRAESVTVTLVYTYNAQGLRVAQSVTGNASTYAWDWASGLPEMLTDGDNLYLVGHDTLGRWDGAAWVYHLPDELGSVRQVTDGAGAVVSSREWTPFGVEVGAAQAGLGYTGEWWDAAVGLQYLRARWYEPRTGRFLTEDSFPGTVFLPPTQHAYAYAANDPIRYTDPTGNITWEEVPEADRIVQQIDRYFDIEVVRDWGWWNQPLPHPAPGMPGNICRWDPGGWTLVELRLVDFAVARMATVMGGDTAFRNFLGHWEVSKTPSACGRGCTRGFLRRIELIDNGLPPTPGTHPSELIIRSGWEINFDAWTVAHELGHAWDANQGWRLSKGLEEHTGGVTVGRLGKIILPGWLWIYCDEDNRRPGCNAAGYFYGEIPPKGSDVNFNREEDFAESVAAYVFPDEAQQWVREHFFGSEDYEDLLYYDDYRDTLRWHYINGLSEGTITVP
jgi:RHS repeat-associated protein